MKKSIIFLVLFLITLVVRSQDYNTHVFKFLPVNMFFNTATFEMEFQENKNSIIVDASIPMDRSIIGRSLGGIYIDPATYSYARMHTYGIRGAYRHYIKSNNQYGYYYEGYVKWQTIDWNSTITLPHNGTTAGTVNGYLYTTNIGIQSGYQFVLSKRIVVDLYLIGLEYGRVNGRTHSLSPTMADADYMKQYIQNIIKRLPYNAQQKSFVSSDKTTVDSRLESILYPWFRCGVSIGIKF